ncbi:PTS system fructose-specific transporter subunit IIB [Klebsiella pneumoniae]|uniref:PTS system fructose-specific transporter subunit IIB n=1 Tax=Klebsiella pneumoniae TaxID=573 RepID=A0A508ZTC9_KLEPN|nr:PTS system fructose-specific transporter subunit IIB [Klebsiella pneumoniae]
MNIVGVTACTVGIAHTYIAQKKLKLRLKKPDITLKSRRKEPSALRTR